ncbi:MAG: DUF6144 family protein [Bacteroidales bacterium]|nr:DUF6144 family protein [Bacteroidales bacterium]
MLRSDFCKSLLTPGIACGCVMGLGPAGVLEKIIQTGNPAENPKETPCNEKIEFAQTWVKRFFEIVDQQLDEETRARLMQLNGAACAAGAYGALTDDKPATIEEIDKLITEWQKNLGKENIYRQGGTVFFNYVGNHKGLKISDGYCLCPLIENKPETLSPTYCQCSVGYVGYMFQRHITHKPVQVELLESLRSGGKACRFKVVI